jgi:hypothetical protein
MKSMRSIKHIWRKPLNRIISDGRGLNRLPVELWQEIFAFATDINDLGINKEGSWRKKPRYFFDTRDEELLRGLTVLQSQYFLLTRYSIVLVCKSWYILGIQILWSHLHIDEANVHTVAPSLYKVLRYNPTLSSYVVRFTIRPERNSGTTLTNATNVKSIAKIVPLLKDLEAISCPFAYLSHLTPSIPSNIVFVYGHDIAAARQARWKFWKKKKIASDDNYWHHCRILYFNLKHDRWIFQRDERQIFFNNLTDLRLDVTHTGAVSWINTNWDLPLLKHLSLISPPNVQWVPLLQRVRLTLETIQISLGRDNFDLSNNIVMPNLQEIHVINVRYMYQWPNGHWYKIFQSPNLRRFTMTLDCETLTGNSPRTFILANVKGVSSAYPSIKEIVIIAPMGGWDYPYRAEDCVVLTMSDVARWCYGDGLTLEIISGRNEEKRRFTKESFSLDDITFLDLELPMTELD